VASAVAEARGFSGFLKAGQSAGCDRKVAAWMEFAKLNRGRQGSLFFFCGAETEGSFLRSGLARPRPLAMVAAASFSWLSVCPPYPIGYRSVGRAGKD